MFNPQKDRVSIHFKDAQNTILLTIVSSHRFFFLMSEYLLLAYYTSQANPIKTNYFTIHSKNRDTKLEHIHIPGLRIFYQYIKIGEKTPFEHDYHLAFHTVLFYLTLMF